jgi:hypothetical protein
MDRVGLLVDMDREVFEVMINDESQGVLTEKLPRPMFFVVDMGWYQPFRSVRLSLWRVRSRCLFCPISVLNPLPRSLLSLRNLSIHA